MTNAIFVPGLLCTGELYAEQVEAFSGTLNVTIGDHRAHDNFTDMAAHILSGAPEKFVLAGLSMGGYAAFEIMRQAPERVEALILLNTTARPDAPEQKERREGLIALAKSEGLDAVVDAVLPAFLAEQNQSNEALTGMVRKMAHDTGIDSFLSQMAAIMGRVDSRPTLETISVPTLMICGEGDTLTPPEVAKEIAAGIPGARLELIPDCGHLSPIEQPQAVTAAIKSFLEGAGIRS